MKVFWALIAALVLATGGLLFVRGRGPEAGGDMRPAAREQATGAREAAPRRPTPAAPEERPAAADDAAPEPVAEEPGPEPEIETAAPVEEPAGVGGAVAAADETAPADAEPALEAEAGAEDAAAEPEAPAEIAVAVDEAAEAPEEAAAEAGAPATVAGGSPEAGAPAEPVVSGDAPAPVVKEAGALVLNGRHRIPGSGTEADPYVVDWDTLVSLESDYEPKVEGKTEIPAWVQALDDKHVAITGFIAFPFIAPTADECMVMLNQWDGCCIGVPPTPYDAVEVKLAEAIDLQSGIVNYGTITGVFRTDPYLVNGWLIGLYVMEDAELSNAGGKNAPGF